MKKTPTKPAERSVVRGPQVPAEKKHWLLDLYVAGQTPRSQLALANLKRICDAHLAGRCLIKIIDIVKNPGIAAADQIFVIPMVIRRFPVPIKKIIGDMSNTERVLSGLEIPAMND